MYERILDFLTLLLGPVMFILPIGVSIFLLRKLDTAAKVRRQKFGKSDSKFFIVDIFSLVFIIQFPLQFLELAGADRGATIAIGILGVAMCAVWWTTITTVSQAGIVTVGWRALVSMVVIPSAYIGSFYLIIASVNWMRGDLAGRALAWLVLSVIGLLVSPFIVAAAIRNAEKEIGNGNEWAEIGTDTNSTS